MAHIVCKPLSWTTGLETLDFEWNEETGEVSGKSADTVKKWAGMAGELIATNPIPSSYQLSAEPLRSRQDLAALLGMWYELPEWLAEAYPKPEDEDAPDGAVF